MREQAPAVCFLMETRLDKDGFEKLYGDLPFPNKIVVKYPDSGGGLALIWKRDVQLDVFNFTINHILAKVVEDDGFVWWLTCFYGWPNATQRTKSWALLTHLRSFVDGPWLCISDFNAILHSSEKLSRRPAQWNQVNDFQAALEECELEDLGFRGYPYTWNNRRPGNANTRERLDRVVSTRSWRDKFQACTVNHLTSHASDHLPIILQYQICKRPETKGSRGFKFEESWLLWDECEEVIKKAWAKDGEGETALTLAKEKIKVYGTELLAWGSSKTNPDTKEIKRLQHRIEALNLAEATMENKAEFLEVSKKMDALLMKQEIFWAQRSRIPWLKHGDRNTNFFHAKASQRRRKNYIQRIKNGDNEWVDGSDDIAMVATDYFENLFLAGRCD